MRSNGCCDVAERDNSASRSMSAKCPLMPYPRFSSTTCLTFPVRWERMAMSTLPGRVICSLSISNDSQILAVLSSMENVSVLKCWWTYRAIETDMKYSGKSLIDLPVISIASLAAWAAAWASTNRNILDLLCIRLSFLFEHIPTVGIQYFNVR